MTCQLVGLVRSAPFCVQLSSLVLSSARSHHPRLSFAALIQTVSETLAPSSPSSSSLVLCLCNLVCESPRVSFWTTLHFAPCLLIRRPPLDWQLAESEPALSPPSSHVRGSCLYTHLDHPKAPWRSAGYCRSFESRPFPPSPLVPTLFQP